MNIIEKLAFTFVAISLSQTIWMIWRDLKYILYQRDLREITEAYDQDSKVLRGNYETVRRECDLLSYNNEQLLKNIAELKSKQSHKPKSDPNEHV